MKLKLNRTLRAALVAAITAVGFTLTQAEAGTSDTTLTTTFTNCAQAAAISVGTANAFADSHVVTIPGASVASLTQHTSTSTTVNLKTNGSAGADATFFSPDNNVGNAQAWTLTMSYTSAADIQSITGMTLSVGLFDGSGNWQTSGASWTGNETFTATVTANGDSKTYTGKLFAEGEEHKGKGADKFAVTLTGETLDLSEADTFTVTIDLPNGTMGAGCFMGLQNIGYKVVATVPEIVTSTWQGTDEYHAWSNSQAWDIVPGQLANVVFGDTAQNKTVDVDTTATADSIAVNASGYEFQLNNNLTTRTLDIATDASLSLTGSGTMEISGAASIAAGGSMSVGAGATLKLDDGATAAQLLQMVTGDGNITLSTNVDLEGAGSKAAAPTSKVTGTLTLDHSTLKLGKMSTSGAFADMYVDLSSFSHVKLDNATLWVHAAPMTINGVTVESGTSNIHIQDTSSKDNLYLTLAGTTSVAANSTLKFVGAWKGQTSIQTLAGEGTLDLAGPGGNSIYNIGGGSIGKLQISTNVVSNVTGDLTVGGLDGTQGTVNVSDGKNLTFDVAEGGTHSFTGTLTVGGQIVKKGVGSQAISGTALHRTLDVQAGTLVLNGNFAIDAITDSDTHISYVDASGAESANGFQNASGTINVYSGSGTVDHNNGHFTFGGKDVTADIQDGVYTLAGEVDYTVLYVNSGSETLAAYQTAAQEKSETLAGAVLKDATTTLIVDADFAGTITTTTGTGTANISEGKTVSGSMSNVTLAGAGTYKLQDTVRSLGSVVLGNDWTGAVEISGTVDGGHTFQGLSTNSSSVKLNGVNTWIAPGGTVAANLILEGTDSEGAGAGLTINGADNGMTYKFTGSVSGTGDIAYTQQGSSNNRTSVFEFTGNLSNWSGSFVNYNGSDSAHPSLHFYTAGEATIGAGINAKAGVLDVTLGGGSTTSITMNGDIAKADAATLNVTVAKSTAFNGSVNASSITVNNGATAAFNGVATLGSVTQNSGAGITVGTEGNLTLNGGSLTSAITNNGTLVFGGDITASGLEVNKGTTGLIDVNGKTDSGNGFETTSGDSITIVNNGTGATLTPGGHKVTQDNVEYTIQADGTAVTAGSSTDYSVYYQKSGEVAVSQILEASSGAIPPCMNIYVSDAGVLNVDDRFGFINAAGGEVIFTKGGEVDMVFVTGDAKVSGLTDFTAMMISAGKTATMKEGITSGNIEFSAINGVQVTNTNEEGQITYSTAQAAAQVKADTLTVSDDTAETEIGNSLVVGEIINNNAEGLLLTGNVADGVTLNAAAGDIVLAGQTTNTLSVVDLTIAAGKTVELIDGDLTEGTITVTDTLTGGSATLLANLTLVGGSTLDVDGGDTHALTLGSTLTVDYASGLINLDNDTLAALNAMNIGDTLNLIVAADQTSLLYGGESSYDGMWYDQMFNRSGIQGVSLLGDYQVYAQGDAFGLTKVSNVPEPTTGTLSLLALAALAARRRRK